MNSFPVSSGVSDSIKMRRMRAKIVWAQETENLSVQLNIVVKILWIKTFISFVWR